MKRKNNFVNLPARSVKIELANMDKWQNGIVKRYPTPQKINVVLPVNQGSARK